MKPSSTLDGSAQPARLRGPRITVVELDTCPEPQALTELSRISEWVDRTGEHARSVIAKLESERRPMTSSEDAAGLNLLDIFER